jgi:hypothetical protein
MTTQFIRCLAHNSNEPNPDWTLVAEWVIGRIRYRKYLTPSSEYVVIQDVIL